MYNLHKSLPPPLTKAQRRAQRKRDEEIQKEKDLAIEAAFHNTTVNRFYHRSNAKYFFTRNTERHYDRMTEYMNKYHQAEDDEHQRLIEKELNDFNNSFVEFNSGALNI